MSKPDNIDHAVRDELRAWGGSNEMSAFEAVMWLAEADPRLRSTIVSVMELDRVPDWERFKADHRWLVNAVPRFRQKVVVPKGVGNPVWVEDPDFDLDYHLRRTRLPEPGSDRQMFDAGALIAMAPFDRARAPWEATLIEGLAGGRAAYVLKMHHATTDGLGIVQLMSRVFSRDRDADQRPEPAPVYGRKRAATAANLGFKALRKQLISLPRRAVATAGQLGRQTAAWIQYPEDAQTTMDYLSSAKRMLGIKPVAGSGLFKRRSLSWRMDGIEIPLVDLKAASKAVHASVNDTFLSALLGGFRLYHERMGVTIKQMPIGFPISLRVEGDAMGGNKFAGSQYAAPIAETDPVARIRHIQRFVRDTRAEPALDIMIRLMPVVTKLPISVVTKLTADFTTAQDAQISNIPGITYPVYFGGAQVTHLWPFAPVPGCGMMIAMISHNGRCCIGINSDRAAVTEPELLMECFREGLEEVLALGRPQSSAKAPAKTGKKAAHETATDKS
ncbi:MAG: wax ester/triacylglycerol synthase family O-acyltransferase [Nevskia sp.]|nr:wax ester/triacylglycerol synthase family O-acyltransferase [Nevskia sp.]